MPTMNSLYPLKERRLRVRKRALVVDGDVLSRIETRLLSGNTVRAGWDIRENVIPALIGRRRAKDASINYREGDFGVRFHCRGNTRRQIKFHRVRETQRQVDSATGGLRAVTNALEFELLHVTFGATFHHIGDQSAA